MSLAIVERTPEPPSMDDIFDLASQEDLPEVDWLTTLSLEESRRNVHSLRLTTRFVKRLVDIVVSGLGLLVLWPLLILVGCVVKLTSKGPAIFRQTRVGLNLRDYNDRRHRSDGPPIPPGERRASGMDRRGNFTYGRDFTLYKFRSMGIDAEADGAQFAQENDPRITKTGLFLRKTRLDEIPQLWNVLIGEMTLVGPRPERPEFIKELSDHIPNYLQRLGLKPGITGVAQIVNGYDNDIDSFRRKVAFDVLYLQNLCLWNDFKILLRTISTVVTGKGAL